jgi:lipoyl(octanoyl) transferase
VTIQFEHWGEIEYKTSLKQQLDLLQKVDSGEVENTVVFCSHPSVVTLGRASKDSDIINWQGQIESVQRGGRATYHGPGQLVIYPIIDLKNVDFIQQQDIGAYLRFLEEAVISAFQKMGIEAYQKQEELLDESGKKLLMTGVWVKNYKVASIGIAIKNWVSYHGIAINFLKDPLAFQGISPCGFQKSPMKSLEEIYDACLDQLEFIDFFKQGF